MMNLGTTVFLAWYDFRQQTEHICKGEVVDNDLWAGTKQADMINVSFQPPGMKAPICHHFTADKLSEDATNVPHDDCYLVCGKKTRAYQHDHTVSATPKTTPSDAWQRKEQFKADHWDYERGHLQLEYLDEFYQLWRDAIAAKLGVFQVGTDSVPKPVLTSVPIASATEQSALSAPSARDQQPSAGIKLTKKQKRSTGIIQYQDSIQTSLFE
jgi:hypothetical protein